MLMALKDIFAHLDAEIARLGAKSLFAASDAYFAPTIR